MPAEGPDDSPPTQTNPDAFTKARMIGPGGYSDIAVDPVKRALHLLYVHGDKVHYRLGNLQGVFQEPETIATGVLMGGARQEWTFTRIYLDKNGAPHVVYADLSLGFYRAKSNYYTNRIGGRWKEPLKVFDAVEEQTDWANNPTLAVDDDLTVFMGTKTNSPVESKLARIENVVSMPQVALKADSPLSAMTLVISKGKLMVAGYRGGGKIHEIDKATLNVMGNGISFGDGIVFEQMRATLDHEGDIHVAFANGPGDQRGYYNTLSRLEAKQGGIRYTTSNHHHSGSGRSVRDLVAPDRVYVFHWSGGSGGKHGTYPWCHPNNQVHFVRVEEGRKAQELRPVTERPGGHGPSYRMQPAAAPHPDGGVILVFDECIPGEEMTPWGESNLWITRIGAYGK